MCPADDSSMGHIDAEDEDDFSLAASQVEITKCHWAILDSVRACQNPTTGSGAGFEQADMMEVMCSQVDLANVILYS